LYTYIQRLSFGSSGIKAALAYDDSAGRNCGEAPICSECNEKAMQYCSEDRCNFDVCEECLADHIRRKRTKDHKSLPLDDTRSQADTPAKAPPTAKHFMTRLRGGSLAAFNSTHISASNAGLEGDTESDSDDDDSTVIYSHG